MHARLTCMGFATFFLFALATPSLVAAAVIPLGQQRIVTALATASNAEEFDSSSDNIVFDEPGPFNQSLVFDAEVTGSTATGQTVLNSGINGASLFAVANFSATAAIEDQAFAEAFGRSLVTYEFRLTEEAPFTAIGQLDASGNGVTVFQLNGPSGNIYSFLPSNDDDLFFSESGVLAPGDYDVFITTSGFGQAHPVAQSDAAGFFYVVFNMDATVSVPTVPASAELRVFPNPMRRSATIQLPLSHGTDREILVTIHTADGRAVRTLRGAAGGTTMWDARNERGLPVPAGVYYVHVDGAEPVTSRLTLLR